MKKVRYIIGLLIVGLGAGCLEKTNSNPGTSSTILYRHHFQGTSRLAHNTNDAKIPTILALPASREFGDEILQKLSRTPEELWRKFLPAGAASQSTLVRPLLDDLAAAESYVEVHGPLHHGESVFAIELSEERAGLWRTNLGAILAGWKLGQPSPFALGEAKGWEVKQAGGPALIQFVRSGKWVLIGVGQEPLTLLPGLVNQVAKTGRPVADQPNVPLELEADFPRLGDWLPGITQFRLPPCHLTITGKGDHLRTEVRLLFSEALPQVHEAWKIPTNFIHDPIISFTAARGIAPLLSQVKGISSLGLKELPNQFCAWGPAMLHVDVSVSVPITNPSNVLHQIGPKLPEFTTELLGQSIGGFALISNRNELVWQGWPVLFPQLHAIRDTGTDYLLGGFFPTRHMTNPPPPELLDQFKNRADLMYYDWELTQERLVHAQQMQQLWDMVNHWRFPSTNAPAQKWLQTIAPHLGNTITEVTVKSPHELMIVRKSDFGWTGFELASMARWAGSLGFPWTFATPPPTGSRSRIPDSRTNSVVPKPGAPSP